MASIAVPEVSSLSFPIKSWGAADVKNAGGIVIIDCARAWPQKGAVYTNTRPLVFTHTNIITDSQHAHKGKLK